MKVLYFGYRQWAYAIVKNLIKETAAPWNISAVFTIEKPEATYNTLPITPIVIDPKKMLEKETMSRIASYKPAVLLFYGWSWIIPPEIYTSYLSLCLHTSPLPKYRGGSPLQHQILAGETKSAVSIFQITKGLDKGNIYGQRAFSLKGSMKDIFRRIVTTGTKETRRVLDGLATNTILSTQQDEKRATVFKRRTPQESQIIIDDFKNKTADELYNFIRSLQDPYPNAYFVCKDGKKIFFKDVVIEK